MSIFLGSEGVWPKLSCVQDSFQFSQSPEEKCRPDIPIWFDNSLAAEKGSLDQSGGRCFSTDVADDNAVHGNPDVYTRKDVINTALSKSESACNGNIGAGNLGAGRIPIHTDLPNVGTSVPPSRSLVGKHENDEASRCTTSCGVVATVPLQSCHQNGKESESSVCISSGSDHVTESRSNSSTNSSPLSECTAERLASSLVDHESIFPVVIGCLTPGCDGSGHVTGRYTAHRSVSGCPLADRSLLPQLLPTDNRCPTQGCDGSGHTTGNFSSHRTLSGCPRAVKAKFASHGLDGDSTVEGEQRCPVDGCDGSGHVTGRYSSHRSPSGCPLYTKRDLDETADALPLTKLKRDEPICCPMPGCEGTGHSSKLFQTHRSLSGCPKAAVLCRRARLSLDELHQLQIMAEGGKDVLSDSRLRSLEDDIKVLKGNNQSERRALCTLRSEVTTLENEIKRVNEKRESEVRQTIELNDWLTEAEKKVRDVCLRVRGLQPPPDNIIGDLTPHDSSGVKCHMTENGKSNISLSLPHLISRSPKISPAVPSTVTSSSPPFSSSSLPNHSEEGDSEGTIVNYLKELLKWREEGETMKGRGRDRFLKISAALRKVMKEEFTFPIPFSPSEGS